MRTRAQVIVTGLTMVLLATSLCGSTRARTADIDTDTDTDTDYGIAAFNRQRASYYLDRYCRKLGCIGSPTLHTRPDAQMPADAPIAFTTRKLRLESGCEITIADSHIGDLEILAHESCHCRQDYRVLDTIGYAWGISTGEVDRREREAEECARRIAR